MPSTCVGCRDARDLENGRADIDRVREMRANLARLAHLLRPVDDHRVACAAEMRRDLLAPLERAVACPCPGSGVVRCQQLAAPHREAAPLQQELELLLGGQRDAVQRRELVEGAAQRPLHAGSVVAPDPDDERVLEIAHLLDRVEDAADVPVGVLAVAREHLHLACVQAPVVLVERVPGGHRVGSRRELRLRRDHAELLLPLEGLVAVSVVAHVELSGVLVGPLLRHVMRCVAAAGREVGEPRLLGILRVNPVQPLDRLVGHVVRQVVRLLALAFRDADGRVVDRDHGIPLARLAAEEAPEVVEPPGVRPPVERAARPLLVVRRQVPLAEDRGRIAVLLQDLRERSAILGQEPCVARGSRSRTPRRSRSPPCGGCAR